MRKLNIIAVLTIATAGLSAGYVSGAGVAPTSPAAPAARPVDADPAGLEFFEKRIRPLLSEQCYKCHASTSDKVKGSLLLDSRAAAMQGGDTGPAVVPGHPEKSLLIEAVNYSNDDMKMPPKNKLKASEIAELTKWIQMGAPWPAEKATAGAPTVAPNVAASYDKLRKEHWAWQPLHDSPAPAIKDAAWPHNEVDHFVLSKLDAKGLKPVGDADKATLIRRVTFDLTGLPPTPEEVASFEGDTSSDAFAKRVDKLLASPAFGERWGRHWLDIARFGESTGSSRNVPYNAAWRYRDYVIDAFNKDKPYDQFICEQIAGDLMPSSTLAEHNEHIIATGFLAIGVKDLNEKDHAKYVMDNVDEQIDVTTRSIMALTVACARCHDHKFDPIPTTDYYSLAGIFKSTDILSGVRPPAKGAANKKGYEDQADLYHLDNVPLPPVTTIATASSGRSAAQLSALESRATALQTQLVQLRQQGKTANVDARKTARQELLAVKAQIASLESGSVPAPSASISGGTAIGVRDSSRPMDTAVCVHGEPHDLGQQVSRGFVSVVPVRAIASVDPTHSGRLELAHWLTSSDNPLTPRVMVNRIWAHLFGEGIVRTVDNFGSTGEAPADAELLDHLASQFMANKWSVKSMVREIVLSHAYQLSSSNSPADFLADPGDRLTWRMPSRRLDAEEIRDAMLFASGKLELSPPQGSMVASLPVSQLKTSRVSDSEMKSDNRSVYLPILRDLVPPVLDLFDFAEPTMVIGSRDTTTVPTQALFLMNDAFVIDQSRDMATRVQNAPKLDDAGRVDLAYRLSLGRNALPAEKARAVKYIGEFQRDAGYVAKETLKNSRADAWASFCQALLGSAEFRYLN